MNEIIQKLADDGLLKIIADNPCTACTGTGWYYATGWPSYRVVTCDHCGGAGML